ncbi:hypothetical protein [Salisaeta longa]|uniref:hypothetical protein n=1 Tax=Salisaeta longa TaxID=503170 RepID=UPI0003B6A15B|nr:hypothetical protein [Salisaeta longa]
MAILGPTRLVLICSGTFDFADVDLTRPLHLVGPNNVGKTTLVNLLQLLYVDSFSHMSFAGYSLRETRRYYFPERHSYVLFECQTPEGLQVFGVHGTGPTDRYNVQRFAYKGSWNRSDFLTENNAPRPIDEVKPELALKNFRLLEARHLRAALTGIGNSKTVRLGLVPVQSHRGYNRFLDLFKGLIRLRHLDQKTLRSTLCKTYADELGTVSLDLKKEYAGQFNRMQDQRDVVRKLERIEDDIKQVLSLYEQRQTLRTDAVHAWSCLTSAIADAQTKLNDEAADVKQAIQNDEHARNHLQKERHMLDEKRDALLSVRGKVESELERMQAAADATAAHDVDTIEHMLNRNRQKQISLRAKVQSIDAHDPKRIRTQLRQVTSGLEQSQRRLANLKDAVGPMLRKELGAERLDRLFRVLNPQLLDMHRGSPHLHLTDVDALLDRLRRLDDALSDDCLRAPWGTLSLDGLAAPPLDEYIDPERIRTNIENSKQHKNRLQQQLRIAENRSTLEAQAEELQNTIDALQERLRQHREAQVAASKITELRSRKEDTEAKIRSVTQERDAIRDDIWTHDEHIRAARAQQQKIQKVQRALQAAQKEVQAPPSAWDTSNETAPVEAPAQHLSDNNGVSPEDLLSDCRSATSRYNRIMDEEQRTDKQLEGMLRRIHRQTTSQYERDTLQETLDALQEELDGLAQRRTATERMWQQLMTGIGRKLNDLLESLDALEAKVDAINRRLRGTSISDLKQLKLVIAPDNDVVRLLKRMAEQDAMPLFSNAKAHADDVKRLDAMLREHPRIHLTELFDVAFEVTTADGTVKSYDGLRAIESNGTSISIKVLVYLVLINDLLNDERCTIPFYLDEASSLDDRNLAGIVRAAQRMDFVPILASPTESTAVEHLYYLRSTDDRVYLSQDQRVRLQPASDADVDADTFPA